MQANLNIILHSNQKFIDQSPARFKVIKTGKQFGKTIWAIYRILKAAGSSLNGVFWYVAPSYRQAKEIAWQHIKWMLPPQCIRKKYETELIIELTSGSRVCLKGADNEDSLRGVPLNGVVYDEAAYINPYLHEGIIASQLISKKGFANWISSPNKNGRNYFSNLFEDARLRKQKGDLEWDAFYYTIYDNPTLSRDEIEKTKERTPDSTWQTEYMAIESEFAGQKFSEYSDAHNIGEYEGNEALLHFRGLDWGLDHPSVCLWAKVDIKNHMVYIYDELAIRGQIIESICQTIKDKTGNIPIEWSVIDPSASKHDPISGRSIRDEYARWGVGCLVGDRRERGYDIVKMFLKKGYLKIHPKCKNLIYELRNLQWGDKEGDDCCLIAGTKIHCKGEIKSIEDVKTGDFVLTRNGYKKVLVSAQTNESAEVYSLTTSNGMNLIGTYNHPMFLSDGSIKNLGDMKLNDMLLDIRCHLLIQLAICKLKSYLKPVKNSTEFVIIFVGNIFKELIRKLEEVFYCIGKFGNVITDGYRKNFTFTTKITIDAITKSGIWNFYQEPFICRSMPIPQKPNDEVEKACWKLRRSMQPFGMGAKKEEYFTNGLENYLGKIKNSLEEIVIFVEERMKLLSLHVLNFVILIAKWLHFAQDVRVTSLKYLPTKRAVFNLSIEENNEYVANGLLVHNCDALRYLLVRIHDFISGMNMFEVENKVQFRRNTKVLSFNDPLLFPNRFRQEQNTNMDWVMSEVS